MFSDVSILLTIGGGGRPSCLVLPLVLLPWSFSDKVGWVTLSGARSPCPGEEGGSVHRVMVHGNGRLSC